MKVIGAIIAGGKSSRMGGDEKSFLKLSGKCIIDLVIGRLEPQVERLLINANGDSSRFSETGLDVVPDVLTMLTTPLAGLHACLRHARDADFLVTVPSDTPFLPLDLVVRLIEKAGAGGVAIAQSAGQDHYIIGAWNTGLLGEMEMAIEGGSLFRVKDWVRHISAPSVDWPHLPQDPFFNVNTPEDLRTAERILGAKS